MFDEDSYAEIAPFYDLEFDQFDEDVELYLGYAGVVGGPVLELGCGTGRLLVPLASAGYDVVGVDSSSSMIDLANRRVSDAEVSGRVTLHRRDMLDLTAFEEHAFRLVFIAINSFLHLDRQESQIEALRQVRRVVHRDGLLVIDVFNPTPETLNRMDDRTAFDGEWHVSEGKRVQRFSHRHVDSSSQTITTRLFYDLIATDGGVSRHTANYRMRYVHRYELELLLTLAGFELEGIYGSYALDELASDSEHVIAVAHRTPNAGET